MANLGEMLHKAARGAVHWLTHGSRPGQGPKTGRTKAGTGTGVGTSAGAGTGTGAGTGAEDRVLPRIPARDLEPDPAEAERITRIRDTLCAMKRSAVRLSMRGGACAAGRFGGVPDVPPDFEWPYFETDTFTDNTVKPRPLAFLAQFDCAALSKVDPRGLLPRTGLLSFFYEMDSLRGSYDPEDAGCARVYWFPDRTILSPAEFPEDLKEAFRFPMFPFFAQCESEYPDYDDFLDAFLEKVTGDAWSMFFDSYREVAAELNDGEKMSPSHKLLGWPDIIQSSMASDCGRLSRSLFPDDGPGREGIQEEISAETKREAAQTPAAEIKHEAEQASEKEWRLLFQLDSFERDSFDLFFGDGGMLYFYIREDDLAAHRFDRVWLFWQCG